VTRLTVGRTRGEVISLLRLCGLRDGVATSFRFAAVEKHMKTSPEWGDIAWPYRDPQIAPRRGGSFGVVERWVGMGNRSESR
jgi:hypothetical protein